MAAAFLRAELALRRAPLHVCSAGLVSEGLAPPPAVLDAMKAVGCDLSSHRSRLATPAMLEAAGLVVAMERRQVAELAVMCPKSWPRTFTAGELLRLAQAGGGRRGRPLGQWAEKLGAGRTKQLGYGPDDIPDPLGAGRKATEKVRDRLAAWAADVAPLLT